MERENYSCLERPRLDLLFEQAVRKPLVMVIAGAGYGKTQTVYSFVRKCNVMTAWMQLSPQDNYPWRFWENFIQAAAFNDEETRYKLAHTGFPETKRQFDRYLSIPRQVVDSNRKYIFVYDDFHLIQDKKILQFMERSLASPFPSITSILISRTEPALDLGNMEALGRVSRITEIDLRFSQEEIHAYCTMQHISLGAGGLPELYRDSEGWAFAIHLVGLSIKSGSAAMD
ncbi:MAG: helix-turn-helix transcriptional regulator, partial [Spirochaetaceae bacterium]|nr:helix-turn-helix transcriptional regulator [Spirochaetaceae bacterium]